MPESDWFNIGPLSAVSDVIQTRCCGDKEIAVVLHNGTCRAFDNFCPHLGFPLDGEPLQEDLVVCSWHRACFRMPDGAVVSGPCESSLRMHPVEIRDENVWVQLG